MKRVRKIVWFGVLLIAAFLYAHIHKANAIYDRQTDNTMYRVMDLSQASVTQEFVSTEDSMCAVRIKCQQAGEVSDQKIILRLEECDTGKTVAQSEMDYDKIRNGKFNEFSFDTINNCRGKRYRICMEEEPIVLYTEPVTEEGTELKINSEENEGTLILKTVTYRFDTETFFVFLFLVLYVYGFFQFLSWLFSR